MAAIASHLWLDRAPQPFTPPRPGPTIANPQQAVSRAPQQNGAPPAQSSTTSAASRNVRVVVERIAVPAATPATTSTPRPPLPSHRAADAGPAPASLLGIAPAASAATTGNAVDTSAAPVHDTPPQDPPSPRVLEPEEPALAPTPLSVIPRERSLVLAAAMPLPAAAPLPAEARSSPERKPADNPEMLRQTQNVLEVLNRYTRAYENMDVRAAKAIWPSVDDRALRKAFEQLDGQQVRLASCGVSINGPQANARCRGSATYRPKIGRIQRANNEWTFNLSRDEAGWQIVNARIR